LIYEKTTSTLVLALILIPSLFALPLTAIIFQQSGELAKKVKAVMHIDAPTKSYRHRYWPEHSRTGALHR
jgi:hypothetical protein